MKIKQILFLLAAGALWLPAAEEDQVGFYAEDGYSSEQVDGQEQGAQESFENSDMQESFVDNPYLGEGFSPAQNMQERNTDDAESADMLTSSYDGQSSDSSEDASEVVSEDAGEEASTFYGPEERPYEDTANLRSESFENESESEEFTSQDTDAGMSEQASSSQDEEDTSDAWASSNS